MIMRRKDREVLDSEKIDGMIRACHCCRLGFCDNGAVYIVPLSFGYEKIGEKRVFYFHSASEGRKIDLIKTGNPVGFELDTNYQLQESDHACGYTAAFQSVIGTGYPYLIEEREEKIHALQQIMLQLSGKTDWTFDAAYLDNMAVFRVEVTELSCKEHE